MIKNKVMNHNKINESGYNEASKFGPSDNNPPMYMFDKKYDLKGEEFIKPISSTYSIKNKVMERTQYAFRIIYKKTTSHQPEGWYDVAHVWALDRDDARQVFRKNYNNKNTDGTWSSVSYEILEVDRYDGNIDIKK